MIKTNKIYQNYKIQDTLATKSKETFGGKGSTADRGYMNKQMKNHFDFFESHKVEEFQSFIKPLHKYGFKTEDQRKLIEEFVEYMKKKKNIDIFLLKKREMKKANAGERNILMNRIAIEYPNEFISFIKEYLNQNYPLQLSSKNLIKLFQEKIKKLIHPQTLNDPNLCNLISFDEFFNFVSDQKDSFSNDLCELLYFY